MLVKNAPSGLIGIFTSLLPSDFISSHSNGNPGEFLIAA